MKRREIWTVSGGSDYASKPRPVVILQDDRFSELDSITVCPFTSDPSDLPLFRLPIEPASENGLKVTSQIMVDKITTVPKTKLRQQIGVLAEEDMFRLELALSAFLGFAR